VSVRNLERLFSASHVAVVEAGAEPTQLGHIVLRNLLDAGFPGVIYPISRSHESVAGVQAYPRIADAPTTPDLVLVCTPAAAVPELVRECAVLVADPLAGARPCRPVDRLLPGGRPLVGGRNGLRGDHAGQRAHDRRHAGSRLRDQPAPRRGTRVRRAPAVSAQRPLIGSPPPRHCGQLLAESVGSSDHTTLVSE
jgi:CoA binding domain